jgi:hypothetical protein
LAPFFDGVGDVRLDLLDRLHVDQRPDHGTRLEPVGDLHGTSGLGQPLSEGVSSCTRMRLAQTQVSPALRYFEALVPLTAVSISASSKTMNGALLPRSSDVFSIVAPLGTRSRPRNLRSSAFSA